MTPFLTLAYKLDVLLDRDLACRLEETEGTIGASFVDARNRLSRSANAATRTIHGAIAIFDGPESPLTQTFALGTRVAVTIAEVAEIEAFFDSRGADTQHEVCPLAGVETTALLVARGYHPIEMSNVLTRALDDVGEPSNGALRVRAIDPVADGSAWIETAVEGWSSEPSVAGAIRALAEVNIENRSMTHFAVERDGAPIATGSLGIHGDVALLAGASTIPSARGQGAQRLLLATRLAAAREQGCSVAMIVAEVGSISQRNAERDGFRVGYTRTKWRRSR